MYYYERLRDLREDADLTQKEAIQRSDVARNIRGSAFADRIVLEDASTGGTGQMRVSFTGTRFTGDGTTFSNSFVFNNPTQSLTIVGGTGADLITVKSIDRERYFRPKPTY